MVNGGRNFILSWSVDPIQPTLVFSLYTILLCSSLLCCSARDNITFNNSLSDQRGETLVSAGERFELGFFTPDESSSSSTRYVGIWYHNLTPRTVVWVANRDSPLFDRGGYFEVTEGGNLEVLDGKGNSQWSTKLEFSSFRNKTVVLVDSGNLVLISNASTTSMILWESFHHPTDTFLPGMKMEKLGLTSWKSLDDPSTGDFTFNRDQREAEKFIITKKSTVGWYWWSDRDGFPNETTNLLLGIRSINGTDASTSCLPLPTRNTNPTNKCVAAIGPTVRLVMNFTGKIEHQTWDTDEKKWSLIWREPEVECDRFNFCGNFSIVYSLKIGLMISRKFGQES